MFQSDARSGGASGGASAGGAGLNRLPSFGFSRVSNVLERFDRVQVVSRVSIVELCQYCIFGESQYAGAKNARAECLTEDFNMLFQPSPNFEGCKRKPRGLGPAILLPTCLMALFS